MPAAAAFVDQYPGKAQTRRGPRNDRHAEANCCRVPVDEFTVGFDQIEIPGPHSQCLAAMGPEPAVKYKTYTEQVPALDQFTGQRELERIGQQREKQRRQKKNTCQQQRVIANNQHAFEKSNGLHRLSLGCAALY